MKIKRQFSKVNHGFSKAIYTLCWIADFIFLNDENSTSWNYGQEVKATLYLLKLVQSISTRSANYVPTEGQFLIGAVLAN